MSGRTLALATLLIAVTTTARAQDEAPDAPTLTGSLATGAWSGTRNVDDEHGVGVARFIGKLNGHVGEVVSYGVEGRIWNQDVTRGGDRNSHGEFREAWLDLALGESTNVRFGKQLMTWGRADGLNPTDNINPKDFTRLMPDVNDLKLGSWALRASHYIGNLSFTGLWLVYFEPHHFPLAGLPPGATVGEQRPAHPYAQGAFKVETSGGAVDASLSYYDGFDHFPDLHLAGGGITLIYPRIRVIGADAAKNLGRFGLRGEASYTFQDHNAPVSPLPRRRDVLYVVGGIDRSFFEYLNINLQYIGRYLNGFVPADADIRAIAVPRSLLIQQYRHVLHGISARIGNKWLNETLEVELSGVIYLAYGDFVLSPKATYALTDHWSIAAGADYYHGPSTSLYGYFIKNRVAYVEVKYGF